MRRIDELERHSGQRRFELLPGGYILQIRQKLLPLAQHVVIEQQRAVRVGRLFEHGDGAELRDHRRDGESLHRRSLELQLLGIPTVDRKAKRHLSRGDQRGQERVPFAHRDAVGCNDVGKELLGLLFAHGLGKRREPTLVVHLDAQAALPFRIEQVLIGFGQLVLFHFARVVGRGVNVERDSHPFLVRRTGLGYQIVHQRGPYLLQ